MTALRSPRIFRLTGGRAVVVPLACFTLMAVSVGAWAQDTATEPSTSEVSTNGVEVLEGGAVIRYLPEFFESYNAISAQDMLRWVPGIGRAVQGQQRFGQPEKRGFGSDGDQVLINGKRLSGKSNNISDALVRIQAGQVRHVDVIRGTAEGLDVRSEGTLYNVVLKDGIGGSGSWQTHIWTDGKGDWRPDGQVSYSDTVGDVQYQVSLEIGPYNPGSEARRRETRFQPDGQPFERRTDNRADVRKEYVINGSLSIPIGDGGVANLNGRFSDEDQTAPRTIERFGVGPTASPDPFEVTFLDFDEKEQELEFGGDVEFGIGPGEFTGRLIYSRGREDSEELVTLDPFSDAPQEQSFESTEELQKEFIFRASYRLPVAEAHSLELGTEGARNSLDKAIALEEEFGGVLTPVALNTPDSKVEELRAEIFATHFWTLSPQVALETALNFELSKIEQIGTDVDLERSFQFAKPRMELRYDVSSGTQFRASIERTVSQLDFGNFVTSFDNRDDNIDLGNPDLVPEKAWEADLTLERRFGADGGLVQIRGFYKDISDVIDMIAIGPDGSGTGNIGNGRAFGAEIKTSLRLSSIMLPNTVLDLTYTWQDTETTDPFLGTLRPLTDEFRHQFEGTVRQDIASLGLSHWVDYNWRPNRRSTEFTFSERLHQDPSVNYFMQKKLFGNISLWLNVRQVFENKESRLRNIFAGNIASGELLQIEDRRQTRLQEYIFGF